MLVVISIPTRTFVRLLKSPFCSDLMVSVYEDAELAGGRQQGAPQHLRMTEYFR